MMYRWILDHGIVTLLLPQKADKIPRPDTGKAFEIRKTLGIGCQPDSLLVRHRSGQRTGMGVTWRKAVLEQTVNEQI